MPPTAAPQRPAFLDGPLQLYIGGRHVSTYDRLAIVDPATSETLAETHGIFDVAVPSGDRKHSGFGRELGSGALEPYLTSKSV